MDTLETIDLYDDIRQIDVFQLCDGYKKYLYNGGDKIEAHRMIEECCPGFVERHLKSYDKTAEQVHDGNKKDGYASGDLQIYLDTLKAYYNSPDWKEIKAKDESDYDADFNEQIERLTAEKHSELLYDPGDKTVKPYKDCQIKYGEERANKMYKAKLENQGKVDKPLFMELKDIHNGKVNPGGLPGPGKQERTTKPLKVKEIVLPVNDVSAPEIVVEAQQVLGAQPIIRRERQKADNYFLKTERGLIRNKSYVEMFVKRGHSVIYEVLWANIVRSGWKDKPGYPIKRDYYDKGLLAYCSSYRKLAEACGVDKDYIHDVVNDFHDAGIIRLEFITPEGKVRKQMVAVLGKWDIDKDGDVEEKFYRDMVFLSPKAGNEGK